MTNWLSSAGCCAEQQWSLVTGSCACVDLFNQNWPHIICCSENKDGIVAAVCDVVDRLPSSSWEPPGHLGRCTGKSAAPDMFTHLYINTNSGSWFLVYVYVFFQVCDLAQALRDGVLLCQLLNNLLPQAINLKEINLRPQMSQVTYTNVSCPVSLDYFHTKQEAARKS